MQIRLTFTGDPVDKLSKQLNKNLKVFPDKLEIWMRTTLVSAMVDGGLGIEGIAETEFYQYITSDIGLSELGINRDDPPKLLNAYRTKAFSVIKKGKNISLRFGNVADLKLQTPHPYAGIGHLQVTSWLEFFIDKVKAKSGFVPRSKIPAQTHKHIRLSDPLGGLMLPRGVLGSTGRWQVPSKFFNYDKVWFQKNIGNINKAILNQANILLKDVLN